jgi:hypothetical protein
MSYFGRDQNDHIEAAALTGRPYRTMIGLEIDVLTGGIVMSGCQTIRKQRVRFAMNRTFILTDLCPQIALEK